MSKKQKIIIGIIFLLVIGISASLGWIEWQRKNLQKQKEIQNATRAELKSKEDEQERLPEQNKRRKEFIKKQSDPYDIKGIIFDIKKTIKGEQGIITKSGIILKDQTKTEKVNIDPSIKKVTFGIDWTSGELKLSLTNPQGIIITPDSALEGFITFISGPTYNYYTIKSPVPGEWQLNIKAIDSPQEGEKYTVRVSGQTNLTLNTYFNKDEYQTGQVIGILASLSDEQGPITGATIEVIVQPPPHWQEVNEFFSLYDDSLHYDGKANDGIYGNIYTNTLNKGNYIFNLRASGKSSQGYNFTREKQDFLFVKQATQTATISGNIFYGGRKQGLIYIQAWQNDPTMYGSPDYIGSITTAGSYILSNLTEGTYFLSAYLDSNNNKIRDTNEAYGVYGEPIGVMILANSETTDIDIILKEPKKRAIVIGLIVLLVVGVLAFLG